MTTAGRRQSKHAPHSALPRNRGHKAACNNHQRMDTGSIPTPAEPSVIGFGKQGRVRRRLDGDGGTCHIRLPSAPGDDEEMRDAVAHLQRAWPYVLHGTLSGRPRSWWR